MKLVEINKKNITEKDLQFIMDVEQRFFISLFKRKNLKEFKEFLSKDDAFFSKVYIYALKENDEYLGLISFCVEKNNKKTKKIYLNYIETIKDIDNGINILSALENHLKTIYGKYQLFIDIKNIRTEHHKEFTIKVLKELDYRNLSESMDILNKKGFTDEILNKQGLFRENYTKIIYF